MIEVLRGRRNFLNKRRHGASSIAAQVACGTQAPSSSKTFKKFFGDGMGYFVFLSVGDCAIYYRLRVILSGDKYPGGMFVAVDIARRAGVIA